MFVAKLDATRGDMVEHAVAATPSYRPVRRVAGDALRTLVPVGDDLIFVDEVNPVVKVVDKIALERVEQAINALREL